MTPLPACVDWRELASRYKVSRCAYHWVDDASIAAALEHFRFDDPAVPHTPGTHRAHRIASIIRMMEAGVVFDPLQLTLEGRRAHLKDGHHRLRAYQYRKALEEIPVVVTAARRAARCGSFAKTR